jgi:hypothetical protein
MAKAKRTHPLVQVIERFLAPGTFISYGRSWDFVRDLEKVKNQIDALVKAGDARQAVELYELFLAGCYDKANELDDSGGNLGMFFQELFISWIVARQRAGCNPEETVRSVLRWLDSDEYGFCYDIEGMVAKALDGQGLGIISSGGSHLLAEVGPFSSPITRLKQYKAPVAENLTPKEKMARKLRTPQGRATYAKRKGMVEPIFGQIKPARGFRQFLLRGQAKMRGEWSLICLTHNLRKLFAKGFEAIARTVNQAAMEVAGAC